MKIPSLVEIEINSQCNLSCSYCPNSVSERIEKGDMDPSLFSKIIQDLKKYDYKGKIAFEFYNEPLLSPHLEQYLKEIKRELPAVTMILYTNAVKMGTYDRFKEVRDWGVDLFIITKHEQVENNLAFEKVYGDMSEEDKLFVDFKPHQEIKKYNRAGMLPQLNKEDLPLTSPCSIPEHILTITVKGNVLSCFEDFNQKYTFGLASDQNVIEIWNSEEYQQFRNQLSEGKREFYDTCSKCNRIDEKMEKNLNKHLIDEEEEKALIQVLREGSFFRYRQEKSQCDLFEEEFANYLGTQHCRLVNSGTNALVAALMALEISEGDEVIIPSYTFVATAAAVLQVGATPIVANIDQDLLLKPEKIKELITEKTKAVIPVHMDGIPCEIDKIIELCQGENLYVIEDTAQALGASYKGKKLGTFGDFGCFSFNRDKTITCGEGGAIVTNSPEAYEKILYISDTGIQYNPIQKERFKTISPGLGLSMRMSDLSGAMLRVQVKKIDRIIEENKKRHDVYRQALLDNPYLGEKFFLQNSENREGQVYSALHIRFKSPDLTALVSKKFLEQKIFMIPMSMRVAHFVWKWNNLLTPKGKYSKALFLQSLEIAMGTLRMEIDITEDLDQVKRKAMKMSSIIGSICENS